MATQLSVILSSGSLVDIDATLFIQLGVFLFMLAVLKLLLFNPVVQIIEARREATVGTLKTAADLQAEAMKLQAEFDAEIDRVRTEASAERAQAVSRAKKKEREVLGVAKEKAEQMMAEMRAVAATEMKDAREKLERDTREMATLLVETVLERKL